MFYPCIAIVPPEDPVPLDEALRAAATGQYDWLLVTSVNTVRVLAWRLEALEMPPLAVQVAAVGPKTADAVRKYLRIDVTIMAQEHTAEGLISALGDVSKQRILLPQSAIARPVLAGALREAGADVTVLLAYQTVIGQGGEDVPVLLTKKQIDAVVFTSSSTVRYFLQRLESEDGKRSTLDGVGLAAIGPITAKTMESLGLKVDTIPDNYTVPALIEALDNYFIVRLQQTQ
jgi:uroporphyrinogen-III synthase